MTKPLHIVQIAPEIGPGSGVGMVAYALEREFEAAGATVERFTLEDARGKRSPGSPSRIKRAWDVVWFSTIGTARAKRFLAQRPGAVSICHNDVVAGDVYVNHGIVSAAMRARGHYAARMVRNPLHLFTLARDRIRYRGRTHRAIVTLSSTEAELLRKEYGRVRAPITVVGNGVDLERFRPPTARERSSARVSLGIANGAYVVLFVGNEFDRKGLPILIDALGRASTEVELLVVGGDEGMVAAAHEHAAEAGVGGRVMFVGPQSDVRPYLHAADVFSLPSAYESSALVYLEALACGIPVIATPVGVVPDIIQNGINGCIVRADAESVAIAIGELGAGDHERQRSAARSAVESLGWSEVAHHYLVLLRALSG